MGLPDLNFVWAMGFVPGKNFVKKVTILKLKELYTTYDL